MDYITVSNKPIFWVLCSLTVLVTLFQSLLFMRQANKATLACNIDPQIPKKAFKIGLVNAIGPACAVFIVMVGLMASIGGPMAWMRLSIIGSASTELSVAAMGASAAGATIGGEGYTLDVVAVSWIVMGLNGAGWLIFTALATPGLEKVQAKLSGGDSKWMGKMSLACCVGVVGYLSASQIVASGPSIKMAPVIAIVTGALSMIAMNRIVVRKAPKLADYTLGVAMVIGIVCAMVYQSVAA